MALVRNGMVDLAAAVGVAHMAAAVVVEALAEVVEVVPAVLGRCLTFDPMTTVLSLLADPAAANKRANDCLTEEYNMLLYVLKDISAIDMYFTI
ncbi:unnamed protein product [Urochloa humidicola]